MTRRAVGAFLSGVLVLSRLATGRWTARSTTRIGIRADLIRTNQAIRRAVPGVRITYFRQPGGRWTSAVVRVARELGMVALHWSADPRDWERPGAAVIARRTVERAGPGATILLHDGGGDRGRTVSGLPVPAGAGPAAVRYHVLR